MRILLFAFATLLFVACGSKVAQPELVEEGPLPEYELLSIEEPRMSTNGYISPSQNLIYNIEIERPYEMDSLELLQEFYINKGKGDFPGINKIIVRAYMKETSSYGVPYASLILIGTKKDIEINKRAEELEPIKDDLTEESGIEVKEPLIGKFYCERSHDWYVFKQDNSGQFIMQGVPPTKITWQRKGKNVTIVSEIGIKTVLNFDEKNEVLEESSQEALEIYGTKLIFHKRN